MNWIVQNPIHSTAAQACSYTEIKSYNTTGMGICGHTIIQTYSHTVTELCCKNIDTQSPTQKTATKMQQSKEMEPHFRIIRTKLGKPEKTRKI